MGLRLLSGLSSWDAEQVFEWVMCSDAKRDSHRFMDLVQEAISKGEAKRFKAFSAWAKEVSKKPVPKDPLGPKPKKHKAKADEQSLVAAIRLSAPCGVCHVAGLLPTDQSRQPGTLLSLQPGRNADMTLQLLLVCQVPYWPIPLPLSTPHKQLTEHLMSDGSVLAGAKLAPV